MFTKTRERVVAPVRKTAELAVLAMVVAIMALLVACARLGA